MSKFSNWLFDLGEKSSRTDIWVVLIAFTYLGCILNIIQCQENPIIKLILIAMFADLGINAVVKHGVQPFSKNKNNDNNE